MSDFTITSVDPEHKTWQGDHGTFHIYTVGFDGGQGRGTAELKQKASSPVPAVGMVVDAEIVQKGGRPPELKRVWKQGASNGGGGGRPRDPKDTAQIVRQHSQEMALRLLALEIALGTIPSDAKASELLTPRIDWFQKDAESAEPARG